MPADPRPVAKGNIGNFLQHFVALTAARRLAEVAGTFEYVDPFAMAPWEGLDREEADFAKIRGSLATREDAIAHIFSTAFRERTKTTPDRREYPNTIALLLSAGIVPSRATLCEINDEKREELTSFLNKSNIASEVHGDFRKARFGACAGAALVVLDPLQVQAKKRNDASGYMTVDDVRGLLGAKLSLLGRAKKPASPPCIATIFSFSEVPQTADETDRALRADLETKYGWRVQRVRQAMVLTTGNRRDGFHQAWWCASHESVEPVQDLQGAWNAWRD